jgi:hypothetical protein
MRMLSNALRMLGPAFLVLGAAALAQPASKVPDFSGSWSHNISHYWPPESGPKPVEAFAGNPHLYQQELGKGLPGTRLWIGDYRNPILQPWAAERVKARGDGEIRNNESDWQPLQLCKLPGVPHILLLREALVFLQEPRMITMIYQRDHQQRRVFLNQSHPRDLKASPYGHSVGHYEGDTLVVDTIGMTADDIIDYFGTPATKALHVVERYRIIDRGNTLEARFTVEDPNVFTTAWSGIQRYRRGQPQRWEEIVCAENPKDVDGGEYPIPRDDTPDF